MAAARAAATVVAARSTPKATYYYTPLSGSGYYCTTHTERWRTRPRRLRARGDKGPSIADALVAGYKATKIFLCCVCRLVHWGWRIPD